MSFLKYFSKKIYFLKSERDYKTIRKKNFIKTDFFHVKKIFESMQKKKQKKKSRLK